MYKLVINIISFVSGRKYLELCYLYLITIVSRFIKSAIRV